MPAAYTSIVITNTVIVCDLTDNTNYSLVIGGWAPQVAPRRRSTLGGLTHEDVSEQITINVYGSTGAVALENLHKLAALLNQADEFSSGANVEPVLIEVLPQGSGSATPVKAMIVGTDGPPLSTPPTWNDHLMLFEISDVTIRFRRRGLWLRGGSFGVSIVRESPLLLDIDFGGEVYLASPLSLTLNGLPAPGFIETIEAGIFLIAGDETRIKHIDPTGFAAPGFTTFGDSAAHYYPYAVLHYDPTTTTPATTNFISLSSWNARAVGVVALFRNNSATTEWNVVIRLHSKGHVHTSRAYTVDASTTAIRSDVIGYVSGARTWDWMEVEITASSTADTLDIGQLALIDLSDNTSRILAHGPIQIKDNLDAGTGEPMLAIEHSLLSSMTPQVQILDNGGSGDYATPEWVRGDAYVMSTSDHIVVQYFGRNSTFWRLYDDFNTASVLMELGVDRSDAFLVPL